MRKTSPLTAGAAIVAALLSSGIAVAQPASTGDVVSDPVDTGPGQGMNFTLGAGAGAAPDYEGSDDYELEDVRSADRSAAPVELPSG